MNRSKKTGGVGIRMKIFLSSCIIFFSALVADGWGDLTGRWSCNDGGRYYLRQTGDALHWYGEATDASPAWTNVFFGRINDGRIKGRWADVPKGRGTGSGNLELAIENNGDVLRVVNKTGGLNGSRWKRQATNTSATRPLERLKPSGREACARFNLADITVQKMNTRWKIIDGDHWIFDFGSDEAAAHQALVVIRHYRMDRLCTIGRPEPSFSYLLAKGGIPMGAMAGEACVAFAPQKITVSKIQGRWKIVAGRRGLFDFGRSETDARQALAVIRQQGFSQRCSVGGSGVGFTYLRR